MSGVGGGRESWASAQDVCLRAHGGRVLPYIYEEDQYLS